MVADPVLEISGLNVRYGRSHILQGVDLVVGGEPLSLIGRNGMGKTTLCNAIVGLVPSFSGSVRLAGKELTGLKPHEIARSGIGYVPQGRRVFPSLSVAEHLKMVAPRNGNGWTIKRIYELFPPLATRKGNGAMQLSGGEQQMLAIARALLLNPHLLIMDEPSEGLAPIVVEHLVGVLRDVAKEGVGLLLVEQNLGVATSVADHLAIMVTGRIALETTSTELVGDEAAQRRYLGVSSHLDQSAEAPAKP
ncbi:MAG: ABC transporter ATP-binding protein [Chloroflexi bacterium]|nr:ABC transporter ATP-binding protein [Chloroflexota bacterium]